MLDEVPAVYDAESDPGLVSFTVRFAAETVMVGYPKAHLWVEIHTGGSRASCLQLPNAAA
jgi:hypothetical protein